nr:MAG TPA: hypothetical protein [Crassvirales sp.]
MFIMLIVNKLVINVLIMLALRLLLKLMMITYLQKLVESKLNIILLL